MPKFNIETPDAITVAKRDGATVDVDLTKIPESFFADFVTDGVAEYIRDSSSAALANAFGIAHPKKADTLKGNALKEARNSWGMDNVATVATESAALMTAARDRLYNGERRVARTSNVDPLDQWRIKVLRATMRKPEGADLKAKHDAIDSADQADRRAFLLGVAAKNADWVDKEAAALKTASEIAAASLSDGMKSIKF